MMKAHTFTVVKFLVTLEIPKGNLDQKQNTHKVIHGKSPSKRENSKKLNFNSKPKRQING